MDWTVIIGVIGVISGVVLGWSGRTRSMRQDIIQEAGADALQRADVDYIKRGVDDIKFEQRAQGQRIDVLTERVTRLEEIQKSLHKRVDRFEQSEGRGMQL